jgi:hypothetical protein
MAAMEVGAIDQYAAHAHLAHVAKGDLPRPRAAIKAASAAPRKLSIRRGSSRRRATAGVGVEKLVLARGFGPAQSRTSNLRS